VLHGIVNFTAQQPRLAGAAIAAFAAVRQIKFSVRRCVEQRLIGRGLKAAAGRSGAGLNKLMSTVSRGRVSWDP